MSGVDSVLIEKWTKAVIDQGFTVIPNLLIEHKVQLGLSAAEFLVLVCIEKHRWDGLNKPWPSNDALSRLTGISPRQVGRITTSLEDKGVLAKVRREGRTCLFDMNPLVDKLQGWVPSEDGNEDDVVVERQTQQSCRQWR